MCGITSELRCSRVGLKIRVPLSLGVRYYDLCTAGSHGGWAMYIVYTLRFSRDFVYSCIVHVRVGAVISGTRRD